jgi:Zn-finger nucleic acid-binding protein
MLCPTCITDLKMAERHGVEIDYCPQCRGVWLDRGELDKIIERASRGTSRRSYEEHDPEEYFDRERDSAERSRRYGHRRRSFLEDLFDFD